MGNNASFAIVAADGGLSIGNIVIVGKELLKIREALGAPNSTPARNLGGVLWNHHFAIRHTP